MKLCIVLYALLLCTTATQGLQSHVEDEWDALDEPTKELYKDKAHGLSAPELASESREREADEAVPVRQALPSHSEIKA